MDTKITKKRLAAMLSYDWLKIVALIIALIFVWSLIFTTTATRITAAQQFTVFNYWSNGPLGGKFNTTFATAKENIFSYEVLETTYTDLSTMGDTAATVLQARSSVAEGDLVFVPKIDDKSYIKTPAKDENNDGVEEVPATYFSHLETFVSSYAYSLYDLNPETQDGYFKRMESYLNTYYLDENGNGDWENGKLNEQKVKDDFVARITANGDKRFKKSEQIEQGKLDEIERIQKYNAALKQFYGWYDEGAIQAEKITLQYQNGETFEGYFALNLCPTTTGKTQKLWNYFYYYEEKIEENGTTSYPKSSKDMCVCFFKFDQVEKGFEYESLLFLNYLINACIELDQESQVNP